MYTTLTTLGSGTRASRGLDQTATAVDTPAPWPAGRPVCQRPAAGALHHRPRRLRTILPLLALVLSAVMGIAGPASAATWSSSGCNGGVSRNPMAAFPLFFPNLGTFNYVQPGNITVTRSGCYAGDQTITVDLVVWRWQPSTSSWVQDLRYTPTAVVRPGFQRTFSFGSASAPGTAYVSAMVTWRTPAGQVLGRTSAAYVHAGDYACNNTCQVRFNGSFYYMSF